MSADAKVAVSDQAMRRAGWIPKDEAPERCHGLCSEADELRTVLAGADGSADVIFEAAQSWHRRCSSVEHPGAFVHCPHDLCRAVNDAAEGDR